MGVYTHTHHRRSNPALSHLTESGESHLSQVTKVSEERLSTPFTMGVMLYFHLKGFYELFLCAVNGSDLLTL